MNGLILGANRGALVGTPAVAFDGRLTHGGPMLAADHGARVRTAAGTFDDGGGR